MGAVHRKVVTVLFCDVVGSTALAESVDPEALQGLLARYFERMKAIAEGHGGSVEKFIGDAVMAVFGVPAVHEDDALRACRAAVEMRNALPELGIEGRIGVNTGEVVTDTEERLATGDAVNVAARLQQAAAPNEILVGEETLALVGDSVETELVEPLRLKGKSLAVAARRLVSAQEAPERKHGSRFVGRERETQLIRNAWTRVLAESRCELVTIVGDPGIGKSRLVAEALGAAGARIVRARCLPYGEGIAYWPVVEVIKQLDALPRDEAAAAAIRSLLGELDQATSAEEIAWAFRKLLEQEAPLTVVFDDVHSGEETFLDLVEGVGLLSAGAPLLLLCTARPELLDRRPQWTVDLRLEPLGEEAVASMTGAVPPELGRRIAAAAGGNPLFLTEMLAMAMQDARVDVPPTLRALLSARLDQLDTDERRVLETAAVEGEVFHRGALQALVQHADQITPRLTSLVRRGLIRPDRSLLPDEDGFRFRHILIRDAAYGALPKSTRADLHERYADWLDRHGATLLELDEIAGYHLEQAAQYRSELGRPDRALAERAGDRLASAGRRALWRGDERTAAALLGRALRLLRPVRLDVRLELELAGATPASAEAAAIAEEAAERARTAGDETGESLARLLAAFYRTDADEIERRAATLVPTLERAGEHAALVRVWFAFAQGVANPRGRYEDQARAAEEALRHAELAGQAGGRLFSLGSALVFGPRPADEALEILRSAARGSLHPATLMPTAWLLAMLGRFEEAWAIALEAFERRKQLVAGPGGDHVLAEIAWLEGDRDKAAGYLDGFCRALDAAGEDVTLATYAGRLALYLAAAERFDEASAWTERARELAKVPDWATHTWWREGEARILAHRQRFDDAEGLAREAFDLVEQTDALSDQGEALVTLAEVLEAAGKTDEAVESLEQALGRFERKRSLAMVTQVRRRLEQVRKRVA